MGDRTLLLVDGHSLAFRSYYAFAYRQDGGLRTSTGIPTSICYGFLNSLLEFLKRQQPDAVAIAFDLAAPTFRHKADDTYKAGRPETPADFIPDLKNLQRLLAAMNICTTTAEGYEADDVIGTLTKKAIAQDYAVKIFSGDQDLFQLIDDAKQVSVMHLGRGDKMGEFHAAEVVEKLGITPEQVVDYKALCGDSSDNIPGVKGIGSKTAAKLLAEYGSLENVLAAIPTMKGAVKKKLEAGVKAAQHSQFMAQIECNTPIEVELEHCQLVGFNVDTLIPLLEELELKRFISTIDKIQVKLGGEPIDPDSKSNNKPKKIATKVKNSGQSDQSDDDLWFDFEEPDPDAMDTAQSIEAIALDVQIIDTEAKLNELINKIKTATQPVAWDTETTSLNPRQAEIVGIGCCWGDTIADVAYIPLRHLISAENTENTDNTDAAEKDPETANSQNLDPDIAIAALRPILESNQYAKVFQNAKYDRLVFRNAGIMVQGVVFDTMIASYVVDPEASHNLSDMSRQYLQINPVGYKELVGKRKSIAEVEIAAVAQYCGCDAYTTYKIKPILQAKLEAEPDLLKLFQEIELPLEPVLAEMEWTGIRIDKDYLANFSQELETDLESIAAKSYAAVGREFNLNSPKQLSEILLERLGEKFTKKSRKSKTGYSTDINVLHKLQGEDELIDLMIEHRSLAKLKSTYVDALPALVDSRSDRVHTDYNQTVAATGRLSSSNPNLQNIPIRTAFSRRIRAGFLPEQDWLLVSADYSQIELRILAHLAQEPELVKAYNQGDDVHTLTAQLLLEKEEISSEERRLAKIINYGVIYGMGARKFNRETGVSVKEAQQFIDAFYQRYAKIFEYMQTAETEAEAKGYVTTVAGRRRYFRDLKRMNGYRKAALLRSAVNTPIQGTSADIIKIAMVSLHELMQAYEARLLLQVHDELVFEVPEAELDELLPLIKSTMESALPLSVPLVVDVHVGKNWMEAK
ncbi:DNA polymerase I [Thalassoporum mexicanum PCC 7367]|uniref:DNA polymerase I n=1 Tax=Thalassoporum mexicanum TaxID=3457544 RepID=UPI00029FA2D5|nr:DNA polymerase I [Pseudanabaena sp. PCC 7367]AFY70135.1 DNA polymerase I [Pseudanabaena sp. PCC 7367]